MNLIITDHCNRSCPYCFARTKVKLANVSGPKKQNISLENVDKYLDFLERSHIKEFKILGGEPTLHPQLTEIIKQGLQRRFKLFIFTNGLWPATIQKYFQQLTNEHITLIFNVNEPDQQTLKEKVTQQKCMQIAGQRGMIGFNLYHENFDLLFTIELIDNYGLVREVRLGCASPIVRVNNVYIRTNRLPEVGKRLVSQLRELEKHDILGSFDCGFPLCMFAEKDLGHLTVTTKNGFKSMCDAIIDVGPDLSAWPCFPLSEVLNVNLLCFENQEELLKFYRKRLAVLRTLGSMDECISCKFLKRGQCCGGCMARTIVSLEEKEAGDSRVIEKLNLLH